MRTLTKFALSAVAATILLLPPGAGAHRPVVKDAPPATRRVQALVHRAAVVEAQRVPPATRVEVAHIEAHLLARYWLRRLEVGRANASWYGPGLWGNSTASGTTLRYGDKTIAHRSKPFGTICTFRKDGRVGRGVVRDRGPFVDGVTWDLEQSLGADVGIIRAGHGVVASRCFRP